MSLLAGLMPPSEPMTADDFNALHPDTQLLVVSGAYRDTWPEVHAAYIQAAAERDFIAVIDLMSRGVKFKVH